MTPNRFIPSRTQLARFSISHFLGVVMATSILLLKSIPKAVVEWWGHDYAGFEVVVFWLRCVRSVVPFTYLGKISAGL